MAVLFEKIDNWCRPRFICDACEQPITAVRSAMVVYGEPPEGQNETLTSVWHAHKDDACQFKVRGLAGHTSANGTCDELAYHLAMIAGDVGMFPEVFTEQYDHLLQQGRVPEPLQD